jgi:hypothetical protein
MNEAFALTSYYSRTTRCLRCREVAREFSDWRKIALVLTDGLGLTSPDNYSTSPSPFDGSRHIIAQFLGSLQRSLDPDNLHLAGGDLSGRFAVTSRSHQLRSWLVSIRRKIGAALFLGCACVQPRQINPFGQCSPVGKARRCVPMSRRLQLASLARRMPSPRV